MDVDWVVKTEEDVEVEEEEEERVEEDDEEEVGEVVRKRKRVEKKENGYGGRRIKILCPSKVRPPSFAHRNLFHLVLPVRFHLPAPWLHWVEPCWWAVSILHLI